MVLQIRVNCCDEFCPLEGMPCGLPEPSDIEKGLRRTHQVVWMCHSNSSIVCAATDYMSEHCSISIDEETALFIDDPEEFFKKIQEN